MRRQKTEDRRQKTEEEKEEEEGRKGRVKDREICLPGSGMKSNTPEGVEFGVPRCQLLGSFCVVLKEEEGGFPEVSSFRRRVGSLELGFSCREALYFG
jgi:hypothetical protein